MTIWKPLLLSLSLVSMTSCVTAGGTTKTEKTSGVGGDDIPTKVAPGAGEGNKSRMLDCVGENQTAHGTTRKDCLPNDADGAARDTEAASGGSDLRP